MENLGYSINAESGGINFKVELSNREHSCLVTQEALQAVDPINRMDDVEKQFLSNRSIIEDIAIDMILKQKKNTVYITESDVKS